MVRARRSIGSVLASTLLGGCNPFDVCSQDIEISGFVSLDDMPAASWSVSAGGFGGPVSRLTDPNGRYSIQIDSDRWPDRAIGSPTVFVTPPPALDVVQVFPEATSLGFPGTHTVTCGANFGLDFRFETTQPQVESARSARAP